MRVILNVLITIIIAAVAVYLSYDFFRKKYYFFPKNEKEDSMLDSFKSYINSILQPDRIPGTSRKIEITGIYPGGDRIIKNDSSGNKFQDSITDAAVTIRPGTASNSNVELLINKTTAVPFSRYHVLTVQTPDNRYVYPVLDIPTRYYKSQYDQEPPRGLVDPGYYPQTAEKIYQVIGFLNINKEEKKIFGNYYEPFFSFAIIPVPGLGQNYEPAKIEEFWGSAKGVVIPEQLPDWVPVYDYDIYREWLDSVTIGQNFWVANTFQDYRNFLEQLQESKPFS